MIFNYRSPPKCNYFAPEYDYKIWQSNIENPALVEAMRKLILIKEKEIIAKYPDVKGDGGTGLGTDSLTSRFGKFNVFKWTEPCFVEFQDWVRGEYLKFLQALMLPSPKTYVTCWANVMRKGQIIQPHWHSHTPNSYLSAHFTVSAEGTQTGYQNPFDRNEWFSSDNDAGKLTIFPSFLMHGTTMHNGDSERVTIAMDINTEGGMEDLKNSLKADLVENFTTFIG